MLVIRNYNYNTLTNLYTSQITAAHPVFSVSYVFTIRCFIAASNHGDCSAVPCGGTGVVVTSTTTGNCVHVPNPQQTHNPIKLAESKDLGKPLKTRRCHNIRRLKCNKCK
jgi:hypothetical protein